MTATHAEDAVTWPETAIRDATEQVTQERGKRVTDGGLGLGDRILGRDRERGKRFHYPRSARLEVLVRSAADVSLTLIARKDLEDSTAVQALTRAHQKIIAVLAHVDERPNRIEDLLVSHLQLSTVIAGASDDPCREADVPTMRPPMTSAGWGL